MQGLENNHEALVSAEGAESKAQPADIREQRIADYVAESLANDDPFEANLGVVNADLMLIAHRFRHVLEGALQESPETLAEMTEFMLGLDSYLRVVKQVDRFSQLAVKLRGEQQGLISYQPNPAK